MSALNSVEVLTHPEKWPVKDIAIFECSLCFFGKDFEKMYRMVGDDQSAWKTERHKRDKRFLRGVAGFEPLQDLQIPQEADSDKQLKYIIVITL